MNIVLLCKSWNHVKVLDILEALHEQKLTVRGIVALAGRKEKTTVAGLIRKANEAGVINILGRLVRKFRLKGIAGSSVVQAGAINGYDSSLRSLPPNDRQPSKPARPTQLTIAKYVEQHHIELVLVKDLNSETSVAALRRMNTDILLLGGTPIIRASVLTVPKVGTLNVHMALLPDFRGMNVAEWAVFCNAPVGVTVHFVDPGVDTGAILYRETLDVSTCAGIAEMRAKLSPFQHRVLAKCTRMLIEKQIVPEPQKPEDGKQYYLMHEKLKKIVDNRLAKGYRWQSFCTAQAVTYELAQTVEELQTFVLSL
jgi:folate-dependent phosphoribosylglycinamide formyltransferase PurN